MKIEQPKVEAQRDETVVNIAKDKKELKKYQDQILYMLTHSKKQVLDDELLIETLEQSKIKAAVIEHNLEENSKLEVIINQTRNQYKPVSIRGTIIFFVISQLSNIDPMY